jgi:D-3-phosphoglycerate dehydrogenase / 2-oxoglutarate reductase
MPEIFLAPSSFGHYSYQPIILLEEQNFTHKENSIGRKLLPEEIVELAYNAEGIIAGTEIYSEDVINKLPNLKVISRLGVGLDNIDLKIADEKGIKVFITNSPAPAVAELILGLMLDVSRLISYHNQNLKEGKWEKKMGSLLRCKTLGIIGLGTVGKALIRLVQGFDFIVLAYDQVKDEKFQREYNVQYTELNTLLKESDIVSLNINLTDQTKYLINKTRLKLMKSDSVLINTSRGEIVDELALYTALKNGKLAGAGLDVFVQEPYSGLLTELENVVLTPHIGSYAKEVRVQMEIEAAQNLIKGLLIEEK